MAQNPLTSVVNGYWLNPNDSLNFSFNNQNKSAQIPSLEGTLTATTTQTDAYPSGNYQAVLAGISVATGSVSGTTPSMTMSIQTSSTFGGTFTTIATSQAITAAGVYYVVGILAPSAAPAVGNFYRVVLTISGTTPSFGVSGVAVQPFFLTNSGQNSSF